MRIGRRDVTTIGLLLSGGFPMITLSAAIEPFRAANELTGQEKYIWQILSEDGEIVRSSSGVRITPDAGITSSSAFDYLFVVGGVRNNFADEEVIRVKLRQLARHGTRLGGISGGVFPLARAGLLDGYRCSVHWYYGNAFQEEFPNVNATSRIFEIDRDRLTCAGGTASLDLMLTLMSDDLGRVVNNEISSWFQHPRIRDAYDEQSVTARGALSINSAHVTKAVTLMAENIELPLAIRTVAGEIGLTVRQLERLFKIHLGRSPVAFYKQERLKRARELLLYTNLPMSEIAVAAGFGSQSHFARSYRQQYGSTPSQDQKFLRQSQPATEP